MDEVKYDSVQAHDPITIGWKDRDQRGILIPRELFFSHKGDQIPLKEVERIIKQAREAIT